MSNQRGPDSLTNELVVFRHSAGMPCPYLPGRVERQLYAELHPGRNGADDEVFRRLSRAGFRRSHHIVYRPACPGCGACVPVRVPVDRFRTTKGWRRIRRANRDLVVRDTGLTISDEQYHLFRRYVLTRHNDGDMAMMTRRDYTAMVLTSPVDTRVFEFRDAGGGLVAACLTDELGDGFSAVYSYFDPDLPQRSLGSYVVLWLIDEARRRGLPHVYLGFWIEQSPKMSYKSRFRPLEAFGPDGWATLSQDDSAG